MFGLFSRKKSLKGDNSEKEFDGDVSHRKHGNLSSAMLDNAIEISVQRTLIKVLSATLLKDLVVSDEKGDFDQTSDIRQGNGNKSSLRVEDGSRYIRSKSSPSLKSLAVVSDGGKDIEPINNFTVHKSKSSTSISHSDSRNRSKSKSNRKKKKKKKKRSSSRTTRKKESAFKSSSVLPSEDAVSLYGPYPSQVPIPFVNKEGDTPGDEALMKATTYKDLEGYSDYRDRGTPDEWVPRDGRLIRLTGRHPFNVEPPMDILYQNRFITPSSLHYVRNHGACPRLLWDTHILEVAGISVKKKFKAISMDELANMGPPREIPVTVACAGNRRKEQNMIRRTIGFNWGPCAVATSVWKGVLVRDLLLAAGVSDDPHTMFGLHVEFLGFEDLPNKVGPGPFPEEQWGSRVKFGTGIPLSRVMNPAFDIMIAYGQNGEKLAPDHGYPIRLIVPGYTAARNIKWLKQINVIPHVTRNHYYYHDNRVLPPHVSSEDAEVEDWFYKPEYIFNEHNINAAIAIPRHGEEILMTGESLSDDFNVGGYAYTGGGRAVTRVDISLDGGETWKLAKLDKKEKTTGYGMNWCWVWWDYKLTVADIIGVQEIYCRAWDSSNNRQPDKPIWNLMGMGNNHHYKLVVDFTKNKDGNNVFKFLHPIQAGEIKGGWMTERSGKPDTAGYGKVNSEADYNCRVEAAEGKSIYMSKIPDAVLKKASSTGDLMSLISS